MTLLYDDIACIFKNNDLINKCKNMLLPDGVVRICIHSSSSVFMSTTESDAMVAVVGC